MKMICLHRFRAAMVAELEAGSQKEQLLPPAAEKIIKKKPSQDWLCSHN